jgi:hypothetical protein
MPAQGSSFERYVQIVHAAARRSEDGRNLSARLASPSSNLSSRFGNAPRKPRAGGTGPMPAQGSTLAPAVQVVHAALGDSRAGLVRASQLTFGIL